jgi:hypothetical protein
MKFLHKLIAKIHKFITLIEPPNWVLAIIAFIVLFRIPSFFEPYYYGDEMIYLTLGNGIRHGLTLYKQIYDNKPPLIYVTAALASNLFWFKAILAFWMIATTICFWHLTKNLFQENKLGQKISVIIFAILTTIPLLEGNIVNAELFLIGPIILALTILIARPTYKNTFLAGILFGIAALFKIPASFDATVIVIFWLVSLVNLNFKNILEVIKKTLILIIGFAIPILLTFVWFYFHNALNDYLHAAFLQNINYLSSWSGNMNQSFVVKHGPLLIRAGVLIIGFIFLRVYNRKLSSPFLISTIWLLTSLFASTLSGRPYPHYMIQVVPSIALLIGILVTSIKLEQLLTIIPLTLAILVPVYFKFYYYSTPSYYMRFINFASSSLSKSDYLNSFDKYTTSNYRVSDFLQKTTMRNDKVFVWGDTAPIIYALSRRLPAIKYTATYHINDYSSKEETIKKLQSNLPSFIVIPPNSPEFKDLQDLTSKNYILISTEDNFAIWQLASY